MIGVLDESLALRVGGCVAACCAYVPLHERGLVQTGGLAQFRPKPSQDYSYQACPQEQDDYDYPVTSGYYNYSSDYYQYIDEHIHHHA